MRKKSSLIFFIFIASFLYAFPAYNKFWFPFDEGITLVSADMISHGAVPYRDFVSLYGPIQFYLLAFLFRIFGASMQIAHIYILFLHAIVAATIFYIAYRLCRNMRLAVFVWLVGLSCFAPRLGPVASPMWPFMASASLSMLFFIWFLENKKARDMLIAALFASIGFLGRFEMGLYFIACEIFIILAYGLFKYLLPYILSVSVLPAVLALYLAKEYALSGLWECLKLPYQVTIKLTQTKFPLPCFDLRQIFYGSLFFIQVNQHYIPLVAYLATAVCLAYYGFRRSIDRTNAAILLFITLVGTAIFPYAYFGANVTHTMPVIFPALMLSGYILAEGLKAGSKPGPFKIFIRAAAILLAFLLLLLCIKNTDKYIKNVFVKPFTKGAILLQAKRGSVYVPKEEFDGTKKILEYIDKNTVEGEKIFIGFDSHSNIFLGGEPMIYFLSGRLPPTRHFVLFPGMINTEKVQREVVGSLKDVKMVLLAGEGKIIPEFGKGETSSTILDSFIRSDYRFDQRIGKYSVYLKK